MDVPEAKYLIRKGTDNDFKNPSQELQSLSNKKLHVKFNLLLKEAIEEVASIQKQQRLLFSSKENPKKGGRLHPIWDLRSLNFTWNSVSKRWS